AYRSAYYTHEAGPRPKSDQEIVDFDIGVSSITDAGWKELKGLKLHTIRCGINDTILRSLREINLLHANPFMRVRLTDHRRRSMSDGGVRELDLRNTDVSDAGLKELAPLKNLAELDLSRCKVTDAGLKELAPFMNLSVLILPDGVTDKGLKELADL